MKRGPIAYALLSAVLFGVSTPAAKALLGSIDPMVLAGLLYCGAGIGAAIFRRLVRLSDDHGRKEAALSAAELPWLAGAIVAGGIVGPILLMVGLARTEASTASLMLTLEGVATALMAWFIFHENFDRRIALGMACLVMGSIVLAWSGAPGLSGVAGPLAIVAACLAWGLDNNLTRKVALSDPLQIVELKGLVAGPCNIAIGLWMGGGLPAAPGMAMAALVGLLGYGASLALFILALRHLGTARTGAYFSTAPFFGAAAAILVLGEPVTVQILAAAALMAVGIWLHITEHHEHSHIHEAMAHAHSHTHDAHHQHDHGPTDPAGEPHAHWHRHEPLEHAHAHTPDEHHRHRH